VTLSLFGTVSFSEILLHLQSKRKSFVFEKIVEITSHVRFPIMSEHIVDNTQCMTTVASAVPQIAYLWDKQVAQLWQRDRASSINDFRWVNLRLNYRLKGYFSRHCDITQFTLTHHMVITPFLLLGLAAEYRSRRWMRSTLRPTIRCLWHWPAN